jgi:hypothetical protein
MTHPSPVKMKSWIIILSLGVLSGLLFLLTNQGKAYAQTTSVLNLLNPVVSEGRDFATLELGQPWDMNGDPYPDFGTIMKDIARDSFNKQGGVWEMYPTSEAPYLWLHWPGKENAQPILKLGEKYPINTQEYQLLSFRLCSTIDSDALVWWFIDPLSDSFPVDNYAIANKIPIEANCQVYALNMNEIGTYKGGAHDWEAAGYISGLRLHPITDLGKNTKLVLDWVRLTTLDTKNSVPISWSIFGAGGNSLYFYISPTSCSSDGTLIGIEPYSSTGTFYWGNQLSSSNRTYPYLVYPIPESFQPGQYYVYARINGTGNPICAAQNLTIHPAPILSFEKPSMLSGPDYAATELNNPWDMSDCADISEVSGIIGGIKNGFFQGTNTNDDPRIILNTQIKINTEEYKYLSYRIKIDDLKYEDWTSRVYWYYPAGDSRVGIPEGIDVFEGWHTYSIDLSKALLRADSKASWEDFPVKFRFDPHEISKATDFDLDYIKLTGDECVDQGTPFTIEYQVSSAANITFYYDADRNHQNGRTPMVGTTATTQPDSATNQSWTWDTSNVPIGTYYVSAEVNDGVMTTNWYSEVPVTITDAGRAINLSKTVVSEGKDYATQVLGLPWDMTETPYPGPTTIFKRDVDLNTLVFNGDTWKFTSNGPNPLVWMLWTNIEETQGILKLGDRYPIDTSKYKLISFHLCSDRDERALFYWFYNRAPHYPEDPKKTGYSSFFEINKGCHLYTMDMSKFPALQGEWKGEPIGLRFNPAKLSQGGVDLELDWFRITTIDTSNTVPINWTRMTPGNTLYFYASPTGCGTDGIPIGISSVDQRNGTFNWGASLQNNDSGLPYPIPESFEPGNYYIYALENDGGSPICAASQIEIRKAPILTFQRPSMYSGPDYATEELGDPWGFSNPGDVVRTNDLKSYEFNDGIFTAQTKSGKSWIEFNVGPAIDTSKYKYVTYRMKLEGQQEIVSGWVSRLFWWDIGPGTDPSAIEAQIVFEGWHTYSLDLSKALMLETNPRDWDGFPTGFRHDPHEIPEPRVYHLDFFMITGDEIIKAGDFFEFVYDVTPQSNLKISFYYDTDTNPDNGRKRVIHNNPTGQFRVFFPEIYTPNTPTPPPQNNEINLMTGERAVWNTCGVPPGSYYLSAEIFDGVNTTTWYSEVPVIIEN